MVNIDFKKVIDAAIDNKLSAKMNSKIVYAKLISLSPLEFKDEANEKLEIKEEFLVVPKYKVFTEKDIGNKFVLMVNDGGQTYFYLYEASNPQGSNGIPYSFEGDFEGRLVGTCPDGQVVVSTGTISKLTHRRKV